MSTQQVDREGLSLTELESLIGSKDEVSNAELIPYCSAISKYSVSKTMEFMVSELSDESVSYLAASVRQKTMTSDVVVAILALVLRKNTLAHRVG